MQKTFRIVRLLSETRVVINGGTQDELNFNDILEIFEEPEPVVDPVTGETLGVIPQIKGKIRVISLGEKMAICENIETQTARMIVGFQTARTEVEKLNISHFDIQRLPIDHQPITVGDKVRLLKKAAK